MKGLYHKLAWQNLRHNYQFYVPYLLTIIGTAAVFYITMALAGASDLPGQIRYSYLKSFMLIGVWIIGLFAVIFLFYTNSFLMKRRKKELGLYNVLGLGKGHMARVLIWETLYIGAAGIVGGIALGLLFQRLMTLLVYRAVRYAAGFEFYFCWRGMVTTAILFGSILLLNLLVNLLKMRGQNPVTMMREGNAGEREPKTKWFLALLGAAALGVGYYIALTTQTAMEAFSMYFVAVFAVILGTYCLFTAGSIVILKLLRKNKRYYYQTNHFITVSGMLYRMKQNAVGLANICVLCTMVLVMISGTVSLYLGTESLAESRMPADWNTTLRYYPAEGEEPDLGAIRARVAEAAEGQGLEVQEQTAFSYLRRSFFLQDGNELRTVPLENQDGGLEYEFLECIFLTAEGYEALGGEHVDLNPGEVLVYGSMPAAGTFAFYNGEGTETAEPIAYTVKAQLETFPNTGSIDGWTPLVSTTGHQGTAFLVVPDDAMLLDLYNAVETADKGRSMGWKLHTNLSGTMEEKLSAYENTFGSQDWYPDFDGTGSWEWLSTDSQQVYLQESYSMNGGFLFLGVFLGILFLMAAVLIIYYKQVTEGYEDRQRFRIMQKVGLERKQIKKSINGQILAVFFLPLAASAVHVAFDFRLMVQLLQLFSLTDVQLTTICSLVTFGFFALIYVLVYKITAHAYYKIVSKNE